MRTNMTEQEMHAEIEADGILGEVVKMLEQKGDAAALLADLRRKLAVAPPETSGPIKGIHTTIPPGSGLRILGALEHTSDMTLIAETVPEGSPMKFQIWADGCDTVHAVSLRQDGTWSFSTFVEY